MALVPETATGTYLSCKSIGNATEKLFTQMNKNENAVNALFAELDKNLAISRSIFGGAESDEDIRWNNIREKALLRCDETVQYACVLSRPQRTGKELC